MKAVIQRVSSASVTVANEKISQIEVGLLIFLGITQKDSEKDIDYITKKTAELRIFNDDLQKMNLSLQDVGGAALVVSQFTLYANTSRGRRPSFVNAADPDVAKNIYNQFCQKLQLFGIPVSMGKFGAMMKVELINDGPVTIILDSQIVR